MKKLETPPDGIIITISQSMIGERGYRHWLRNFNEAMEKSANDVDWYYWFRQANKPKNDKSIRHIYLCIGGKIRFRIFYAGAQDECTMKFENRDDLLHGKAWILGSGPITKAPYVIKKQGFQGFRYTQELF